MKKRVIALLLCMVIMVAYVFTGCGSETKKAVSDTNTAAGSGESNDSNSGKEVSKEVVTIKFGIEDTQKDLFPEFEKENPNIKLELVMTGSGTEKLMAMLAAGTAPDLIRVTGVTEVPSYAIKGIAMNLDPYFEKSEVFKSDDMLPICNVYRFDGTKSGQGSIYGLPKDWSQDTGMIINKKVFRDCGVEIPSDEQPLTYTQVFELGRQLTKFDGKGRITQLGLDAGFSNGVVDYQTLLYQLESIGLCLFTDDMTKARFTDPEIKKLIQQWIDVKKEKVAGSPILDKSGLGGLADDKVAIENWGYWATGMYRDDSKTKDRLDTDFMLLPTPYPEGGNPAAACTYATGGIIYSKTEHPDEAWKVFEWFFGGKPAEERAKSGWGLPVLKHLMELVPQSTAFDKQAFRVIEWENDHLVSIKVNPYASNLQGLMDKELTPVLFDKLDLDTALENLEKATNQMIEEGMQIAGVK